MKHLWIAPMAMLALVAQAALAASPAIPTPKPIHLPMDRPMGIAAAVNEDVITTQDVEDRALLVMALTGGGETEKDRAQLMAQALGMLIDEALQMQEAKRNGVSISDKEVNDAFAGMEKARGRPAGSLLGFVNASNLSETSLRNQFRSQLAWQKTVMKKLRKQIQVNDADIARAQQFAANPRPKSQVQIAAIAVPVQSPDKEAEASALARSLAEEVSRGKPFDVLGRELLTRKDARPVAAMWINEDELEPPVAQALRMLNIGDTTQPLRSLQTYQIIKLLGRREMVPASPNTEVALKQIQLSLASKAPDKEVDALISIAKSIQANPGTCGEQGIAGVTDFTDLNMRVQYQRTKMGVMSDEIRQIVQPLAVGEVSAPFATKNGLELLMLCERIEAPLPPPDAKEIKAKLMGERAELEAEKMLRNLKRDAFIDIRTGKR